MSARARLSGVVVVTALLSSSLVLWAAAPPAHAVSITVNLGTDPLPDGSGRYPINDGCSLRAALQAAEGNGNSHDTDCATGLGGSFIDVVQIDASLAGRTLAMSPRPFPRLTGPGNRVEIIGPTTSSSGFTIDAQNATRVFELGLLGFYDGTTSATVKIANLTIKRGNGRNATPGDLFKPPQGEGGAIWMGDKSHLTLDNVVLRENVVTGTADSAGAGVATGRGGAIFGDSPTITNNGGAYIANRADGTGAAAGKGRGEGGAIYLFSTNPSTVNGYAVLFEDNVAAYAGAAVAALPGSGIPKLHLERVLAKGNTAKFGSVFYADNGSAGGHKLFELWDSTVTGNSASQGGSVAASFSNTSRAEILRSTLVGNSGALSATIGGTINGSIIKDSTCSSSPAWSGGANLQSGSSGCTTIGAGTLTGLSPTLAQNGGPLVQRTYALLAGSSAIDAYGPCAGLIDARSVPRGIDGNGVASAAECDIGAYEYVEAVVNFTTGTSTVLEGSGASRTAGIKVKLTIPDPTRSPLQTAVTLPLAVLAGSTATNNRDFSAPSSVTIPAGTASGAEVTLPVTILPDDIAEANGEEVTLQLGSAAGVSLAEPRTHHLSIQDDDQAGVLKEDGGNGTSVSEAAAATEDSLVVKLRSQPDYGPNGQLSDVLVRLEPDRDCTARVGAATASLGAPITYPITNAQWRDGRQVFVRAVDDPWDEDGHDETTKHECRLAFTFSSPDPVYAATTDEYAVTVSDDDVARVVLAQSGGSTSLVEGGSTDTYTLRLSTPPDPGKPLPAVPRAPVTVTADPDAQCNVGAGAGAPKALSFTTTTWNAAQTVTLAAVDDPTVELAHSCAVTHVVGGGDPVYNDLSLPPLFAGTPDGVAATIQDYAPPGITNDPPQVAVRTGNGLFVDEATPAAHDSFVVVLDRQPLTQSVTVGLSSSTSPGVSGTQVLLQDDDPATPAAPAGTLALTFTPADWDVPRTVRLLAADDDHDEAAPYDVPVHVRATISSGAVGFSDLTLRRFSVDGDAGAVNTVDLPVAVADDDVSALALSASAATLQVREGGAGDSWTVALASRPYGAVTVTVDPSDQCTVAGGAAGAPVVLTFPAAAWATPQSVAVAAVDDALIEAVPQTCSVTQTAASAGDVLYDGLVSPPLSVLVVDDDLPRVVIAAGSVSVDEAAPAVADTYTVVLASRPDADVQVHAFPVPAGQLQLDGAAQVALTFTSLTWSTPQTVRVTPVDDDVDEASPHSVAVVHSVTSTATGYATAPEYEVDGTATTDVPVQVGDDDTAALTVLESGKSTVVGEDGTTDSYTITLGSRPTATVAVTVTPGSGCTTSPASITVAPADWAVPQAVEVAAVDDDTVEPAGTCSTSHAVASADPAYAALALGVVTADVLDDDVAGVLVTAAGLQVTEGSAATADYDVVLARRPLGPVTVTASAPDGQTLVDGASTTALVFAPGTWDVPQKVAVEAVDDAVDEGAHSGQVLHVVSSAAYGFDAAPVTVDGTPGGVATVVIDDDDGPDLDVVVLPDAAPARPGQLHTWTLRYGTTGPAKDVTVTAVLPPGTTHSAPDGDAGWTCAAVAGVTTCTLPVALLDAALPGEARLGVLVAPTVPAGVDTLTLTASVERARGGDPDPADDTASSATTLVAAPDLRVAVDDAAGTLVVGGALPYAVSWTNAGDQGATGAAVTVTVPPGTQFRAAGSDAAWSCADGAAAGTACTAAVGAAAGATGTLQLVLHALPAAPEGADLVVTATVTDDGANGADPVPADNTGSATTPVRAAALPPLPPAPPAPAPPAPPVAPAPDGGGTTTPPPAGSPTAAPTTTATATGAPATPASGTGGGAGTIGSPEPSSSSSVAPGAPGPRTPPTLKLSRSVMTAGQSAVVTGTAAPGSRVDLLTYSRPVTTYRVLRSTTADASGAYRFVVLPETSTRLHVVSDGAGSASAVLLVRPRVSLRVVGTRACALTASGTIAPKRSGVLVTVSYVTADGRRVLAMRARTGPDGAYRVGRVFTGCPQLLGWQATTGGDLVNLVGTSVLRQAALAP